MLPDSGDGTATSDPTYAFKPSLMGAMSQFTLRPDALDWQIGRRSGSIRLQPDRGDPAVLLVR